MSIVVTQRMWVESIYWSQVTGVDMRAPISGPTNPNLLLPHVQNSSFHVRRWPLCFQGALKSADY